MRANRAGHGATPAARRGLRVAGRVAAVIGGGAAVVASGAERVRLWCDDATGTAGTEAAGPGSRGRVLVLGGARSGKSLTAERFLASYGVVEYIATGAPPDNRDDEWAARVSEHQRRRPPHWRTEETLDLEQVLKSDDRTPVLIDCLTLWLARVMDECDAWTTGEGGQRLAARVESLLRAWRATSRHVVAVSNEVGCGVVPATPAGRLYRDELGRLNALIAGDSDEVWFCTAGLPRRLR
jgi:adenosylcobinamide kinase/adenosylcobinamide-phosphate guanylyltransferase